MVLKNCHSSETKVENVQGLRVIYIKMKEQIQKARNSNENKEGMKTKEDMSRIIYERQAREKEPAVNGKHQNSKYAYFGKKL